MRYHHNVIDTKTYRCEHPLYSVCTLYKIEDNGLAVVQLRYNQNQKLAFWSAIDNNLIHQIGCHDRFKDYMNEHAEKADQNGIYPTVDVRKLMWALKMKPLPKNHWEKGF